MLLLGVALCPSGGGSPCSVPAVTTKRPLGAEPLGSEPLPHSTTETDGRFRQPSRMTQLASPASPGTALQTASGQD